MFTHVDLSWYSCTRIDLIINISIYGILILVNILILDLEKKEFKNSIGDRIVNTCSATYCKTGYKRKGQVAEYYPVFGFLYKEIYQCY